MLYGQKENVIDNQLNEKLSITYSDATVLANIYHIIFKVILKTLLNFRRFTKTRVSIKSDVNISPSDLSYSNLLYLTPISISLIHRPVLY
jgi:hypothetical protein